MELSLPKCEIIFYFFLDLVCYQEAYCGGISKKQDQLIFEILNAELNEIRLRCDALQKKIEAEKKKYQQMKEEIEKLMNEKAKLQEKLDIIVETRNQEESKQRKKIIKPIYVQSRLTNLPSLKDLEKEGIFF
jgi:chromosome segregation ATPase